MLKNLFKDYVYPIAVFSGGMIGVGFLSLPYVAMRSGIWLTFLYFLVLTGLVAAINLIFAEISLKTPDYKRFPGFAKYHLGKWGGGLAFLCAIVGGIGALLAYLIVGGEFLTNIFQPLFGGNANFYTLLYFVAGATIVYLGIKVVAKVEIAVLAFLFLSLSLIFLQSFSLIKAGNIFAPDIKLNFFNLFFPYGPILFSLWGTGLIPEIEEILGVKKKKLLKKILFISTISVSIVYLLFTLLILGITGAKTTETALTGLWPFLGNGLMAISLLAGALATFTGFIMQGIILKESFVYDFKIKHWQAFVMACCTPLILFLLGFKSFIALVSLFGGLILGISGILILLMYKKIGGKNYIIYPLSLVFLLGIIYEITYFTK